MRGTVSSYRIVAVALFGGALSSCDSLTGNKEKSIAITVDNAAITVGQGTRDSILVTITRTNFDKPITLSIEGTLPAGVTRSFSRNPIPAGSSESYLRFIATGAATPGAATVTIRATGDGVAEKGQPIDLTVTVTGSYSLSMLNPSLTVAQGGGGDAMVLLARTGGNASGVLLVVSGVPTGASASVVSPTTDRGATLAITAGAATPPGTYPISITGSAPGITPDQNTQLSLVVIPPASTTSLSLPFCSNNLPLWFAYQNEGFPWQRVTPTGSSFTFAATPRVAIAYMFQGSIEFQANVFFATRVDLLGLSDRDCDGTKNLTGTVSGLTAGQSALVVMGANAGITTTANYSILGVPARPLDLVATRGTRSPEGFLTPDRMIVRRSQDLTGTIPVLDFTDPESFAPVTSTLTVSGFTTGFGLEYQNNFWSATSTYGTVQSGAVPGGSTSFASAPADKVLAGDVHELLVDAFQSNGQVGHAAYFYFGAPGNRSETLGPLLPTPTVTSLSASPYARVRGEMASQSEYGSAGLFFLEQGVTGSRRFLLMVGTVGYYGTRPATWDLVVPDFTSVAGFTTSWMMASGPLVVSVQAFDGRGDILFGGLPVAGDVVKLAYRSSISATLLRQPGSEQLPARRAALLTQYLRR